MRHNVDETEGSDDTLLRGDNPIFPYCFYAFFCNKRCALATEKPKFELRKDKKEALSRLRGAHP